MLWQPSTSKSCSVRWNNHLVVHSYALGGEQVPGIAFSITENTLRVESLPSVALWVLNPKPGCVGNSPAIEIPQHPGAFN